MPVSPIPAGYHTVTPYITVRGGAKAIEFYKQAFGATEVMRFEGPGMTTTPLLDEDIRHDASDCRAAFNDGRLTFKGDNVSEATLASSVDAAQVSRIQWGDDNGDFANDGECDDKRFEGAGMTSTPLLDADIKHDASDCRTAFQQGRLALRE